MGSELAAGGACASKRPSAGGNIGGRRRADLAAQDFDLTAGGAPAAAWGTWRRLSTPREAVRPKCRDVWHVRLASGRWPPRGIPDLVLDLQRVQGHGRTVHARISTARSAAMPVTRSSCW